MNKIAFSLLLILASPVLAGDVKPIAIDRLTREKPVSYTKEVSEVLASKCVGCHHAGLAEGKLSLEDVAGMLKGGKHGPALVTGKADESLLFTRGAHRVEPVMPPVEKKEAKPLTSEELGLLKLWIDSGARDDTSEYASASKLIELVELPASLQPIVAVDVTADGKLVASGRGGRVLVYEVATGRELANLSGHKDIVQAVRFSPDGKRLAAGSYADVTLWDIPTDPASAWNPPRNLGGHSARVLAIDFSPDGKLLATGGGEPSRSGEIKVWDAASGQLVRSIESLHTDSIFGLRFSPDGSKLATGSADKFLRVVQAQDGKDLKGFEGHTHHILGVDWSEDGKQIVTAGADNLIKIWDFDSGDLVKTLTGANRQVTAVRWVPKLGVIAGGSGDMVVRFWNPIGTGKITRTFNGPTDYVYAIATSRDGLVVAAGGADGVLFLWNGSDAKVLQKLEPPRKP